MVAETCTTQSQMTPADRETLAAAASALAAKIQADDEAGIKATTIAEFQGNFTGIAQAIAATSAKVKTEKPQVDGLYLLDASMLKAGPGGNPDASFSCPLSHSASEVDFSIPSLPPGKYAFATVWMDGASPWQLSFLMRQDAGKWMLAGLYPKPATADGHDGLWYWKTGRNYVAQKQSWAAWLYLQEAQQLIQPAGFMSSTHLEKLQTELSTAAPPAVANGISADAPLVIQGPAGQEFHITSLNVVDALGLDVAAHIKVDALGDAAAARKRNIDAATALVTAHPELRNSFHGVWVFSDAPGNAPYATEFAMADLK